MDIGMLWYDAGPEALKDRVKRAAEYYADKHGRKPNLCMVNPDMIEGKEDKFNGIVVRSKRGVMPGHLWIGVDEVVAKSNGSNGKGAGKAASSKATPKAKRTKAKSTAKAKRNTANPKSKTKQTAAGTKRTRKK
jgi:hypothetical protein